MCTHVLIVKFVQPKHVVPCFVTGLRAHGPAHLRNGRRKYEIMLRLRTNVEGALAYRLSNPEVHNFALPCLMLLLMVARISHQPSM